MIGEKYTSEVVLMLNKSSEHYFSVMNPVKHVFQQEKIMKLRDFNGNVSAQSHKDECSVKSHENLPAQITDVLKRIEMLEQIVKNQNKKSAKINHENRSVSVIRIGVVFRVIIQSKK